MRPSLLSVLLAAGLAVGCSSYRYGDSSYASREAAETAASEHLRDIVIRVAPRRSALAPEARLVIPKLEVIKERGTGSRTQDKEYTAGILHADYKNTLQMIARRKVFTRVWFEESNGEHIQPKNGEPVIYLYMPDSKTAGWYYVSGKAATPVPLKVDRTKERDFDRAYSLVGAVEGLAANEYQFATTQAVSH